MRQHSEMCLSYFSFHVFTWTIYFNINFKTMQVLCLNFHSFTWTKDFSEPLLLICKNWRKILIQTFIICCGDSLRRHIEALEGAWDRMSFPQVVAAACPPLPPPTILKNPAYLPNQVYFPHSLRAFTWSVIGATHEACPACPLSFPMCSIIPPTESQRRTHPVF